MSTTLKKVVLVTGASSGIGRAIALFLSEQGYRVYGTSRKPRTSSDETSFQMIPLDVTDEKSVQHAVDMVVQKEGSIDILINNAGMGIAGPVEETKPEEAYRQFDTNFFGVLRMCRAVVPIMRRQKHGMIINIGSVAGLVSIPFQAMYSASKYAVEAMTEALRIEVKPFGIRVALVEPGDTKTGFTDNRIFTEAARNSSYGERFAKSIQAMAVSEQKGPNPMVVAKVVARVMKRHNPPVRVIVGLDYKLVGFLKRVLPARLVEFIVTKLY